VFKIKRSQIISNQKDLANEPSSSQETKKDIPLGDMVNINFLKQKDANSLKFKKQFSSLSTAA